MILHIPHSRTMMPADYPNLPRLHLERHTDWFTDRLFEHPLAQGFVFPYSRFYADMERLADDPLEAKGMGIFYTQTPWGQVYRERDEESVAQVYSVYQQWHRRLQQACWSQLYKQGQCVLIDCHSFSHHQVSEPEEVLPDINIGTNEKTTSPALIALTEQILREAGYSVAINFPYAYAVEPIQDPGFETIMIEINKRTYLTEDNQPSSGYERLKHTLDRFLEAIADYEHIYSP